MTATDMRGLWGRVASGALGTCASDAELANRFDVDEEAVTEELLDAGVERCSDCGWWVESGELAMSDDFATDDLVCEECRGLEG